MAVDVVLLGGVEEKKVLLLKNFIRIFQALDLYFLCGQFYRKLPPLDVFMKTVNVLFPSEIYIQILIKSLLFCEFANFEFLSVAISLPFFDKKEHPHGHFREHE